MIQTKRKSGILLLLLFVFTGLIALYLNNNNKGSAAMPVKVESNFFHEELQAYDIHLNDEMNEKVIELSKIYNNEQRRGVAIEMLEKSIENHYINSGDFVADIGSGSGFWTFPVSRIVGINGKVYSIDIDPIAHMTQLALKRKMMKKTDYTYSNIINILNNNTDFFIPEKVDVVLISDIHWYHNQPNTLTDSDLVKKEKT